jgi:hypothetical protein
MSRAYEGGRLLTGQGTISETIFLLRNLGQATKRFLESWHSPFVA